VGKLSDAGFCGDFPGRGSADDDDVGARANEFAGAGWKRGIIGEPPEQGVRVQKNLQRLLQSFELVVGERLEKFRTNLQSSLHAAGFALALFLAQGLQANERLIAAGDDDLFAFAGLGNEPGEVGLGVMDFDRGHIS
jgi:hypothetical protein